MVRTTGRLEKIGRKGIIPADGEGEGDGELEGLAERDELGDADTEAEGDAETELEGLALGDADGEALAETAVMSSSIACEQKMLDCVAPQAIDVPVKPLALNAVSSATVSLAKLVS